MDGGISVVKKSGPQSERFFDNHYKISVDQQLRKRLTQAFDRPVGVNIIQAPITAGAVAFLLSVYNL